MCILTYSKSTSLEGHISAASGCCRLQFLHVADDDQGLLTHTPPGTGVPRKLLTTKIQKLAQNAAY